MTEPSPSGTAFKNSDLFLLSFSFIIGNYSTYMYTLSGSLLIVASSAFHVKLLVHGCLLFFSFIDFQNLFGIIYRFPQEMKETLLIFRLVGEDMNKSEWLQNLTTELAKTTCTADTVRTGH